MTDTIRQLQRKYVKGMIFVAKTKFIGVEFIKLDGTTRKMTGNVREVLGHEKPNPASHVGNIVTLVVKEEGKTTFKNFDINRLKVLKCRGVTYEVWGDNIE